MWQAFESFSRQCQDHPHPNEVTDHNLIQSSHNLPVRSNDINLITTHKTSAGLQDRVIMSNLREMRRKIGRGKDDDGEANLFAVCDGPLIYYYLCVKQRQFLEIAEHTLPRILASNSSTWSLIPSRYRRSSGVLDYIDEYINIHSTHLRTRRQRNSWICQT